MAEQKKKQKKRATKPSPNNKWVKMNMPNKLILIEGWARDGLTDADICKNLNISRQLFYTWKKKYPEFAEALEKGKEIVDRIVENQLFKNAQGFYIQEEKEELMPVYDEESGELILDKFGRPKMELKVVERKKKYIKADTTAQIFWLKNRKPEAWRDKQHIEHSGKMGVDLSYMDDDELEKELSKLEALENGDK